MEVNIISRNRGALSMQFDAVIKGFSACQNRYVVFFLNLTQNNFYEKRFDYKDLDILIRKWKEICRRHCIYVTLYSSRLVEFLSVCFWSTEFSMYLLFGSYTNQMVLCKGGHKMYIDMPKRGLLDVKSNRFHAL